MDDCEPPVIGSPYIPVDSWVYPALWRLYALGYVDHVFLGMRPWTRTSVSHMLEETQDRLQDAESEPAADEARSIYEALTGFVQMDVKNPCHRESGTYVESAYTVARAISGTPLRDSFNLGSTLVNDYGRPYENGVNNYTGMSGYASAGRFLIYARGEFQGAQSATGYSQTLAQALATINAGFYPVSIDPATGLLSAQSTIPAGPIGSTAQGRVLEAYASAQLLNHVVSFGKQDNWMGPGVGGGMAYSNNAENIYSFRINRIEPLHVPGLSAITGPFRYDFLVGSLKGHRYPNDPWVHVEKISFKPTANLEIGFERTAIWGGKNHVPITLHTFLRSFFSTSAPNGSVKTSSADPGARFAAFDFSYRLPFARKWLTLYSDSEVHDDVSPVDAPRRASWRPGIYLSHVPGVPKLDVRLEGVSTDPPIGLNTAPGHFMYWEYVQQQGYTNNGQLMGDWIGRDDKGGQAWITYHLSGNEWIQVSARNQKADKGFIPASAPVDTTSPGCSSSTPCIVPGGTTLNDITFQAVKRIGKDLEVNGEFTFERWKAPIYMPGQQTTTATTIRLTWRPQRKVNF